MLKGARKDKPTVTAEGTQLRTLLAGVEVREVRNLVTRNGLTTEVYRSDWHAGAAPVAQTLYVSLRPGAVSAWHCHEAQLDRIFVVQGCMKLVLFDDRERSPTLGQVSEFFLDRAQTHAGHGTARDLARRAEPRRLGVRISELLRPALRTRQSGRVATARCE